MGRIDLDSDGSHDELADALRQLEKRQQAADSPPRADAGAEAARRRARREREEEHRRARGEIEGAVEAIRERQLAEEQRAAAKKRAPRRWAWIVLGVVAVAVIVTAALALRPEPLPPPAMSAEEAVRGFWEAIAAGHYQGATVYYPALVETYGSRRQAAVYLIEKFGGDPPTKITVGEAELLPESDDLRVSYQIWRRSGRPYSGEFVVRDSGSEKADYVIVTGI